VTEGKVVQRYKTRKERNYNLILRKDKIIIVTILNLFFVNETDIQKYNNGGRRGGRCGKNAMLYTYVINRETDSKRKESGSQNAMYTYMCPWFLFILQRQPWIGRS
jgi:hypothetical protein